MNTSSIKKHRQTEYYHPIDIIHQSSSDDHHSIIKCHFCQCFRAIVYVTVMDRLHKLIKKPICYSCKHISKPQTNRNNIPYIDVLEKYITTRNSNNGFIIL